MANYRYIVRPVDPPQPIPVVVARSTLPDGFESMTKDELVNTAKAQGLPSSGTKAELIARLRDVTP